MPPTAVGTHDSSLNPPRLAAVERAFAKLDRDNTGFAELEQLRAVYDVARHPRALDGSMSRSQVLELLLRHFEPCAARRGGKITFDEFLMYYKKLSAEVDAGQELDHDAFFEMIVTRTWRLDEPDECRTSETGFIPTTDELPKGLKATRKMHLVWREEDGRVTAFAHVVKPWFARKVLPPALRQHFAYFDEMERIPHTVLPANGCSQAPLDILWTSADDGQVYGLRGLIATVVDLHRLPPKLREHIVLPTAAAKLNPTYLPLQPTENPLYKRSNASYGVGAEEQCQKVLELKRATYTGAACGTVFCGKTGKFSNSFGAGMYCNSSLNVTSKLH